MPVGKANMQQSHRKTLTLFLFENTVSLTTKRCRWEQGRAAHHILWLWPGCTSLLCISPASRQQQRASQQHRHLLSLMPYRRPPNYISIIMNWLDSKWLFLKAFPLTHCLPVMIPYCPSAPMKRQIKSCHVTKMALPFTAHSCVNSFLQVSFIKIN